MARKTLNADGWALRLAAGALALLVWAAAARALGNELLLVSPGRVLARLWALGGTAAFWGAVGRSFAHIVGGFLLALAAGSLLAALAGRWALLAALLRPWVAAVKAVPVASFIILALLWVPGQRLSLFIAFLMVFPVVYTNVLQGVRSASPELLEMAAVFRVPWGRRVRAIYLPAAEPFLRAACSVGLGLCWKAGVAAEVIGVVSGSIGGRLYDAKIYLEIADLFAWTAVIVALSAAFEKLFLALLAAAFHRMEAL